MFRSTFQFFFIFSSPSPPSTFNLCYCHFSHQVLNYILQKKKLWKRLQIIIGYTLLGKLTSN